LVVKEFVVGLKILEVEGIPYTVRDLKDALSVVFILNIMDQGAHAADIRSDQRKGMIFINKKE
jgi:hypothetical protein